VAEKPVEISNNLDRTYKSQFGKTNASMNQARKLKTQIMAQTAQNMTTKDQSTIEGDEKTFRNYSIDLHTAYKPRERTLKFDKKSSTSMGSIES
jgi:hypothetical protein